MLMTTGNGMIFITCCLIDALPQCIMPSRNPSPAHVFCHTQLPDNHPGAHLPAGTQAAAPTSGIYVFITNFA
jgi:hypothetical protein